jgi:hypothetical protein
MTWISRLKFIALFAVAHFLIFFFFLALGISQRFGEHVDREVYVEELRISPAVRRTQIIIEVLHWPVLKPVVTAHDRLPNSITRSIPWKLLNNIAPILNSVVWGAGLAFLLELLRHRRWRLRRE